MKQVIKKVPIPLSGVMLGCASLGNLLQSYSEGVRWLLGGVATALLLLLLLKLCLYPAAIREDLKNPIMASVAATFPMSLMLLSVYYKPFIGAAAQVIWFLAIALHVAIIVTFTARFVIGLDIKKVFASYFIVYIGIAVAGITAPAYGMQSVGAAAFWFGLVCLVLFLCLVGYRYIKYPEMPPPAKPLVCIFAAPASLCLTAYLQSVSDKSLPLVCSLLVLATALYVLALIKLVSLLRLPFYPSYAAFTFPFVISAIALKQSTAFLAGAGITWGILTAAVVVETMVATVLVCYTLVRYMAFLFAKPPVAAAK